MWIWQPVIRLMKLSSIIYYIIVISTWTKMPKINWYFFLRRACFDVEQNSAAFIMSISMTAVINKMSTKRGGGINLLLGPSYMDLGIQDNPPPETTLASVYMWKQFPYRPSQSWPCMNIHNLFGIIKCTDVPLSLSFPWYFDHSVFCEVKFQFLDTNFCFKPLLFSWYSVTLATPRVVPVRRAKVFIWRKVDPPASVTLPAEVRQLVHLSCLSPWDNLGTFI